MSGTRANMIKARGIVTHGSELTLPEGSQRQANNVNIDEDGVITPRNGFNDYLEPTTGAADSTATVNQIMEYKDAILRQYKDEFLEYEDVNGVFQSVTGSFSTLRDGYRTKWMGANSNFYFTSDEGIKKISETSQANLNANMVGDAGGVKAGYASGNIIPTVGGFLLPESKTAYRVVFGTKDNNKNLILGSPSSRFVVTNFNTSSNIYEESTIDIVDYASILDDDYFTYSNSTGKYVVYFDKGASVEPKTSETIGGIYIKVAISGLTADETVAAVLANAVSVIPNSTVVIDSSNPSQVNITTTEEGDITGITASKNADASGSAEARIDTSTETPGKTTEGSSANVKVTGVVPTNATTDYFYQVYRSSIITVSTGLTINDIDPGDELNLVYEAGLTSAEITAGEFEFTDNIPESYRAEALPLYTNEVTGEGILQSNEVPPIALDIELFRNHVFYANTKEKHRLEFTMLSIDDFVTSSTRLIIGNSETTRYYTFVGTAEVTDLTIEATIPVDGDYDNLYSANDERQYYIWYDAVGDFSGDPAIPGAVAYRIDISDLTLFTAYNGTTIYNPGDKVIFNGLNYICNTITTGINDTSEDPSGTETDNGFWDYESDPKAIIASRIETALIDNIDFDLSVASNVITFTHTNNGYTTGLTAGTGTGTTISTPSTDGTGELAGTDEGGDVLLSGLISVGQSIDETARSLVKIISQDPTSPVNAYYLSSSEDLPGNILLEARSLEDNTFYISVDASLPNYDNATSYSIGDRVYYENNNYEAKVSTTGNLPTDDNFWNLYVIGAEFTPELPSSTEVEGCTGTGAVTNVEHAGHGYETGDTVFVGVREDSYDNTTAYIINDQVNYAGNIYINILGSTGVTPSGDTSDNANWQYISIQFSGSYTVTKIDNDNFSIPVNTPVTTVDFIPTFSTIFTPDVESDNKELANRLYFSKKNEPEAVPVVNYVDIGTQDAEIKRILALRDNLFVLKDDGIYVVSGTSAPDRNGEGGWSTRLIDSTKILAPDSAVVLNNQIYCLTEQGVTRITGSGAAIISRGIEDQIDLITNQNFDFASNTFGIAYENDRAYIMFTPEDDTSTSAVKAFRYNIFEQTWSTWDYEATCGHVLSRDDTLYVGNADRNYISKERKNNDRTDHSDRNFSASINANGVNETIVELSTLTDVDVSDVLYQEQEVTINYVNNRLLKKMDFFDTGIRLGVSGGVLTYPTTSVVNLYTPYPHRLENNSIWSIRITASDLVVTTEDYVVTVIDDNNFTFEFDSSLVTINEAIVKDYYFTTFKASTGDNMVSILQELNEHLFSLDPAVYSGPTYIKGITARSYTTSNLRAYTEALVDELNTTATITSIKTYKKPTTVYYEAYIESKDVLRNQVTINTTRPFVEGALEVYKGFTCTVEWNPQHFGDPSALKQIRYVTIMFDQNNFNDATAKFASDAAQAVTEVPFKGKGIAYWGDLPWSAPNAYWGGIGNDIPFRNPVPRGKQKCRYLSITFEHKNAREYFRILGISGVVRAISDRGYR